MSYRRNEMPPKCGKWPNSSGGLKGRLQARLPAPRPAPASNLQPYRPHPLESVAFAHHARPHYVVEENLAAFDVIFEVHIATAVAQSFGDVRQRQIVRGDQAD